MGAVAKVEVRDGVEFHISTGKDPDFRDHEPQWSAPSLEYFKAWLRQCLHPDCDIDVYTEEKP